ncbi:hypothetical protein ACKWTF_003213 [Chironomus riparius]
MKLFESIIQPSGTTHSATVIFFHGSGSTGNNLIEWIRFLMGRNFDIPYVKFIFPTAPMQKHTPLKGKYSRVWFDCNKISIYDSERIESLSSIYETVDALLNREIEGCGIPANRVIIGGFSMGGALALHTAYHLKTNLAGVFCASSYLNEGSIVYRSLDNHSKNNLPPLKMFHSENDPFIPMKWGVKTFEELKTRGVKGDFIPVKSNSHELKSRMLIDVENWIREIVPPLQSDIANKL